MVGFRAHGGGELVSCIIVLICHCSMWKSALAPFLLYKNDHSFTLHYHHYHPLLMGSGRERNSCLEAWKNIFSQRKCLSGVVFGSAKSTWLSRVGNAINWNYGRKLCRNI